jgi:hypothetical protein
MKKPRIAPAAQEVSGGNQRGTLPQTTNGRPFKRGSDARRGRGCQKGAANAGRPPDWLRARMAQGRQEAVDRILAEINKLDYDQLLRLVEKWAPEAERHGETAILTWRYVEE